MIFAPADTGQYKDSLAELRQSGTWADEATGFNLMNDIIKMLGG